MSFRKKYTMQYTKDIQDIIEQMKPDLIEKIEIIAQKIFEARAKGKLIFTMGNGGSAATASHFASDFSVGCTIEGQRRFKAIALTDNVPNLLAWSNDVGFEEVFIQQLKNLMSVGDVVIGISGSGNSENVVRAMKYAKENGATTIAFSGYKPDNRLNKVAEISIHVPSFNMQQVEDIHMMLEHLLTRMMADELKKGK